MRISDWSSDVCSSDLVGLVLLPYVPIQAVDHGLRTPATAFLVRQRLGPLALGGNLRPDFLPPMQVRPVRPRLRLPRRDAAPGIAGMRGLLVHRCVWRLHGTDFWPGAARITARTG